MLEDESWTRTSEKKSEKADAGRGSVGAAQLFVLEDNMMFGMGGWVVLESKGQQKPGW